MSQQAVESSLPAYPLPARLLAALYGVAAYLLFFLAFLYFIFFTWGVLVPKTVDTGTATMPVSAPLADLALIALFGLQHSIMARAGFKRWWTRLIPRPVERSTYVLAATLVLVGVMVLWRPIPAVVWQVTDPFGVWVLWTLSAVGWATVLAATFMTDHFDLFGLRQVYRFFAGREYTPVDFKTRGLYTRMRHPLYSGFFLALWATPVMSVGHLVLAGGLSVYIVVGTVFEERDLLRFFGERYAAYRKAVPRYLPRPTSWSG